MPERSVDIRLSVVNGKQAREELLNLGIAGEEAFNKVGISAERAARQSTAKFTNLSAQIQDVIVSIQGGQPLLRVFIQQGSQIASIYGAAGGAIGIAVAAIGGLAAILLSASGSAKTAAEEAKNLDNVLGELDNTIAGHIGTIDEAIVRYRELTDVQRDLEKLDLARTQRDLTTAFAAQQQTLTNTIENFHRLLGLAETFGGGTGGIARPGIVQTFEDISKTLDVTSTQSMQQFVVRMRQLITEANQASPELLTLDSALAGIGKALEGIAKRESEAKDRLRLLGDGVAAAALTTKEFGNILKENAQLLDETAKASQKAGASIDHEAASRAKTLDDLATELDQNQRLLVAKREGVDAVRDLEAALAGEAAARKLGAGASADQIALASREAAENARLKQSITDVDTARRQAGQHIASIIRDNQQFLDQNTKAIQRANQQAADQAAKELQRPFEHAAEGIQDTFTDTFEKIYSGGISSFSDLASAVKQIFVKMAAELTSLLVFNPSLVFGGAGGTGGTGQAASTIAGTSGGPSLAQQLGGGFGGFGSLFAGGNGLGPGQSVTPITRGGQVAGPTVSGSGFTGQGALQGGLIGAGVGAVGSSVAGAGQNAQLGATIGGAAGGAIGSIYGPVGTLVGSAIGSLIGGFAGSLFGGDNKSTGALRFQTGGGAGAVDRGIFGTLVSSGENSFRKPLVDLINTFDSQVVQLITSREKDQITAALKAIPKFDERFPEDDPSKGFEAILRARATAILRTLGLKPGRILAGASGVEDIAARATEAINVQKTIADLVHPQGAAATFIAQLDSIKTQFSDLTAAAKEYGIATTGLAKAQKDALEAAKQAASEELNASVLGTQAPFTALSDPLRAFQTQIGFGVLSPAAQFKALQTDFDRIAREAQGGSLTAIGQLPGAGQALLSQAGTFGASPAIAKVTTQISSVLDTVLGNIDTAQRAASQGLESAIQRASTAQIDTLRELIDQGRQQVAELKKLSQAILRAPRTA